MNRVAHLRAPRRPEDLLSSPWRFAFAPGWLIYRPIIALRNIAYDWGWLPICTVNAPVIAVGNLSAGGTGKTPFCAWLCQRLTQAGWKPTVLMRGYGGDGGPNDEAQLLAAPVVCDPDRVRGANIALAAGANCIVLDDGFQHRRLARNLDIVLIDALRPWGGGAVIPLGLLREGRSSLRRAGCLVVTRSDQVSPAALATLVATLQRWRVPVVCAQHQPTRLVPLNGSGNESSQAQAPSALAGRAVVLASGVGNPQGFTHTAQNLGWVIGDHLRFPDHHAYTDADVKYLAEATRQHQATLVVTAKDAVKLRNRGLDSALVLEITLGFSPADEHTLWSAILARLPVSEPRPA